MQGIFANQTYDEAIDSAIELSSMGIRVDKEALLDQLEKSDSLDRILLPFHQKILKDEVPLSIGGGIGQSRVLMFILGKKHIAEVQASAWQEKTEQKVKKLQIL